MAYISNPTVSVNNITLEIVPNSVKLNLGEGENNVIATSVGGGAVRTVSRRNLEEAVGMISFEVVPSSEMFTLYKRWLRLNGMLVVTLTEKKTTLVLQNASVVGAVDWELGADASVEIVFKGDPIK